MTKYTYDSIKNEIEDRLIACYRDVAMLYDMVIRNNKAPEFENEVKSITELHEIMIDFMDYIANEKRPL